MVQSRRAFLLLPCLLASATCALAQEPAAKIGCDTLEARQFDFWVGDWEVTADGRPAGHNRIEKILAGCALLESWTGAGASRGRSLNFYDSVRRQWHQTWIDNQGQPLYLDGGLEEGRMVLEGRQQGRDESGQLVEQWHRITWMPNPDGSVRQHWQLSTDQGGSYQTLFDGLYRPVRR